MNTLKPLIRTKNPSPELLAPAGGMESLRAAVNMGCDAVYLGGKQFSARAGAENFMETALEEAIDYCHVRGVKVFITANTLYKDSELAEVQRFTEALYAMGADAFILQDIGAASWIKHNLPGICLHASTQMTAHSLKDVLFLQKAGFDRVTLSRELSLSEIKKITSARPEIETEVFIHGALCVCYSGQCLMSSLIGGRSGNRGNCAQPCRMRYSLLKQEEGQKETLLQEGYLLSTRDLTGLDFVQALREAGVSSLKIEGRMRSPEYVAQAVKSYRQALDGVLQAETKRNLVRIFNRGGFSTDGYLKQQAGHAMMSEETPKATGEWIGRVEHYDPRTNLCGIRLMDTAALIPGDGIEIFKKDCGTYINKPVVDGYTTIKLYGPLSVGDKVYKSYDKALHDQLKNDRRDVRKLPLMAGLTVKKGEPLALRLQYGSFSLICKGGVVEKAVNRPMAEEEIIARLSKTGATPFTLTFAETDIEKDIFVEIKELNRLRREALDLFQERLVWSFKRTKPASGLPLYTEKAEAASSMMLSTVVRTRAQYLAAVKKGIDRVYVELPVVYPSDVFPTRSELAGHFAALPRIDRVDPENRIADLEQTEIAGYLVRTWGQLYCLRHTHKIVALDYSLPVFNRSAQIYLQGFCQTHCLSPELSRDEVTALANAQSELIVYGRLSAMVTALCPVGNFAGNRTGSICDEKDKLGHYFLRDKTRAEFPILRDCKSCLTFILNSSPLSLQMKEINKTTTGFARLEFTVEDGGQTERILSAYMHTQKDASAHTPNLH